MARPSAAGTSWARGLVAPLHERVRHPGPRRGWSVRPHVGTDLLASSEQQPHFGLQMKIAPIASHARSGVQVGVGDAARRLGEAVGHADDHRLLEPEDVAEVRRVLVEHRQLVDPGLPKIVVGAPRAPDGGLADCITPRNLWRRAARRGSFSAIASIICGQAPRGMSWPMPLIISRFRRARAVARPPRARPDGRPSRGSRASAPMRQRRRAVPRRGSRPSGGRPRR